MVRFWKLFASAGALWTLAHSSPSLADSKFVKLGNVAAVQTMPASRSPHVAIIYENGQSAGHPMCQAMADRGFMTLCIIEGQHRSGWEDVAKEVRAAVQYVRSQPGITKVVLYGHSGGGAVASFYEAVAENGASFCNAPEKLHSCGHDFGEYPAVDGVVFPDAHPGMGVMALRMVNPSVTSDGRRLTIDPALDPYDARNGFNPDGPSHYSPDFQARYAAAQAERMASLVRRAEQIKADIASGAINDPVADRIVFESFGFTSHLDELDPTIPDLMQTREPRRLLRNDGSIVTEMIRSSSVGHPEEVDRGAMPRAQIWTTTEFLSMGSVRAKDSLTHIDYCSSNSVTACNVRYIHVPVLFLAMGANDFIGDDERMYDSSPAADREYIVVEGALHGGDPCVKCEKSPGQYANSQRNMFDYIAAWINKRF